MFTALQIQAAMSGVKPAPSDKIILYAGRDTILCKSGSGVPDSFPDILQTQRLLPENLSPLLIGDLDGTPCFAAALPSLPETVSEPLAKVPVRAVMQLDGTDRWNALSRAREMLFWRKQHQFCGACRAKLEPSQTDLAMVCPSCKQKYYPQIAPAIITAVTRNGGTEILLAHNRTFEADVFGLIAGFVEMGETAEQAVRREVLEETGVTVGNVRYLYSQAWPFPNSLMLAFLADYESGEAQADGTEIETLGWFKADALPKLPGVGSIARAIIEHHFIGR